MKGLIKHLLREDMQTHIEMQTLADDVFLASVKYFVNETIDKKNALNVVDRIPDIFTKINVNRFTNLNSFLNEYVLGFKFYATLSALGDFVGHSETDGDILIRYNIVKLKNNIENVVYPVIRTNQPINQQMFNDMVKKVFDLSYDEKIQSTLTRML